LNECNATENFLTDASSLFDFVGVGMVLRKMGNSINPVVYMTKDGDEYEFHTESTFKTTVIKFKLGVPSMQETLDGRKVNTTYTLDGNVLTQVEEGDKKSVITRTFSETEMVSDCIYGDVPCKRFYKIVS
jgi:fatty acid-binding protein 3, muscle and heart